MHVIKAVGILSVAKIMGLVYGCMGVLFAPFFLLFGLIGSAAGQSKSPLTGIFGIGFGIALAFVMPVLYGLMGFVMGAQGGLLYNLFARWVGGFELEIELRPQTLTAPYPNIPPAPSLTPTS
jgi:hypothetical protein